MQRIYLFVALFFLMMSCACQQDPQRENNNARNKQTPVVVVVNYPLEFIVEFLVGPEIRVINPVSPDADPETWLPNDAMIQTIQESDLIITNGADFADWVKKLSLPRSKVLRTSLYLKDSLITVPDFEVHSHGAKGAHSHAGTVAFFWLDPALMIKQAEAVAQKLMVLFPQEKKTVTVNLKKLKGSLEVLKQKLDQLKTEYAGLQWFSQRPVYQYLARRADWSVHHLHWKRHLNPDDNDWKKLKKVQEEHQIPFMLWEQKPDEKLVKELQQRGVASIVFDPLTVKPVQGDYISEMKRQLNQLEQFLKQHSIARDTSKK
ncbi:metal ABC transporter substrate-binding protein [Gimesia aquarii]|uniref:High-affinity zinc transporter periplasmic component n=1 Tax=Gimesia aquarii TaxID=2527964 RepID=A0A517WYJ6_9PLAN|nr:metal ABC transporter substrate-binding protein [Gimesia aquarii]QDU10332.1 high-affinity zinc transporter periplasmic component [Gimesia aquarii]